MIRHAALFKLIHEPGSAEERAFLLALSALRHIPGVQEFEISEEVSPKNPYAFAISMTFSDQAGYDAYNTHPLHVTFVQSRWVPEVAEFMEHDTVAVELDEA